MEGCETEQDPMVLSCPRLRLSMSSACLLSVESFSQRTALSREVRTCKNKGKQSVLSCSVVSNSLQPHGLNSPPCSSVHGHSLGKNTEVGCHALLQGIFPTQGSNPGPPHCRRILYHLSHQENSPRRPKNNNVVIKHNLGPLVPS